VPSAGGNRKSLRGRFWTVAESGAIIEYLVYTQRPMADWRPSVATLIWAALLPTGCITRRFGNATAAAQLGVLFNRVRNGRRALFRQAPLPKGIGPPVFQGASS